MDERLQRETEGLIQSWQQHDEARLRDYLVAEVEDPRLNIQSILTRHFLIEALFGPRFAALKAEELRFAAALNWLLKLLRSRPVPETVQALEHALSVGADDAEGLAIPQFLTQTFAALPREADGATVLNYVRATLTELQLQPVKPALNESQKATFQMLWHELLDHEPPQTISVLEPACGSANDYRFLDAFGLARFLDYTGFDLCEKNVHNARALCPRARFQVGNVFEIDAPDKAFDFCFVHDLFEHLSIEGMEVAIAEICRVTRRAICAGFFNMAEVSEHAVNPVDDYHWNTLSMGRTRESFLQRAKAVHVIHVGTFLKWCFNCPETHNDGAYNFVVSL